MTLSVNAGDRAAVAALLADVPAFASPSWLPEGVGWPELDERAATHRRLLAARREVVAEATALSEQYRREDAAYQEAMTSGFLADDAGKLPTVTPREDREEARRDLRDRALALDSALARFVTETVAAVEEHAAEWLGDLANRREDAAEHRREAERLLVEAREEEVRAARLEHWTKLNAGVHERAAFRLQEMRYVTWQHVADNFTPPPAADLQGDPDAPQLVDPPARPYWDEERRAAGRALADEQLKDAPRDEAEALRQAIEEPLDTEAALARQRRIAEVAAGLDQDISEGRLNLRRG